MAVARAIVRNPVLVIADEPTGNLDPENTWTIMNLLNQINQMGATVVVATHAAEIVDSMKKRVIALERVAWCATRTGGPTAMSLRGWVTALRDALRNTAHGNVMSLASMLSVAVTLLVLAVVVLLAVNLEEMAATAESQVEIKGYLCTARAKR